MHEFTVIMYEWIHINTMSYFNVVLTHWKKIISILHELFVNRSTMQPVGQPPGSLIRNQQSSLPEYLCLPDCTPRHSSELTWEIITWPKDLGNRIAVLPSLRLQSETCMKHGKYCKQNVSDCIWIEYELT